MLKALNSLILSPSPVLLSLVPAGIFLFLTVLGFFDWPMVVLFFFSKKSCATGGQTLRRPDSRLTCTVSEPYALSLSNPEETNTARKVWKACLLARPNSFATKIAQFWVRARMLIKYITWLRSAQPFLFPGSSKLSSCFIYLFIYFFETSQESKKKKKRRRWTKVPLSVL